MKAKGEKEEPQQAEDFKERAGPSCKKSDTGGSESGCPGDLGNGDEPSSEWSKAKALEPSLLTAEIEKGKPNVAKDRKEAGGSRCKKSNAERLSSGRTGLCIDKKEPMFTKSSTRTVEPNLASPKVEGCGPGQPML